MNKHFEALTSYVIGLEETIKSLREENEELKKKLDIQSNVTTPVHDNALECQANETILEDDLMIYEIDR